ncbi:scavenger receptor cysteine-rich domain-containing group B protein-like, partial [Discoglossus pictus]
MWLLLFIASHLGAVCADAESAVSAGISGILGGLRLSDGPNRCTGRVELQYRESWGTVCDDLWDLKNAEVVCRQLNCGTPLSVVPKAHFGPGTGLILMDDVICEGHETSLWKCKYKSHYCHNCNHYEDVGVICTELSHGGVFMYLSVEEVTGRGTTLEQNVEPTDEDPYLFLQLANGGDRCAGRMEVFSEMAWNTVCESALNMKAADVACRHIECGSALALPKKALFGTGRAKNPSETFVKRIF